MLTDNVFQKDVQCGNATIPALQSLEIELYKNLK